MPPLLPDMTASRRENPSVQHAPTHFSCHIQMGGRKFSSYQYVCPITDHVKERAPSLLSDSWRYPFKNDLFVIVDMLGNEMVCGKKWYSKISVG